MMLTSRFPAPRSAAPRWGGYYSAVGVAFGLSFAFLGFLARSGRSAPRMALGALYFALGTTLGLLGCVLCYLTFFSAHSAAASNYNVLVLPPWLLALSVAGVGVMREQARAFQVARWAGVGALFSSLLALTVHVLSQNPQANLQELAVALPLWLGVALSTQQLRLRPTPIRNTVRNSKPFRYRRIEPLGDMQARMKFLSFGSVMVVQQGAEPATDLEFRAFLAALGEKDLSQLRVLILTTGGGPTAEQRVQLKQTMAGRSVRTAVVSDSIKVRFIIATIALINREHHGFTNGELGKAYEFLELTPRERNTTARALKDMPNSWRDAAAEVLAGTRLSNSRSPLDPAYDSRSQGLNGRQLEK